MPDTWVASGTLRYLSRAVSRDAAADSIEVHHQIASQGRVGQAELLLP
jgi:hypothetical protein